MKPQDELNELLKQIQGQDIALTIGPGGKAMLGDPATQAKVQKDVQAMKDFMNKSVEQLAAGVDQEKGLQVIAVRDRALVVPKTSTQVRINAILFASLYAMHSKKVDDVLCQAGVQGHFMKPDGTVSIEPFVAPLKLSKETLDAVVKANQEAAEPKVEQEDAKRNILVGEKEEEAEREFEVGDPVVIFDSEKKPLVLGSVEEILPDSCLLKDMYGKRKWHGYQEFSYIDSVAKGAEWAAKIIEAKVKELGNNG